MYKLFISHASEDKIDVARPLADLLIANGVSVWYDEFELKLGDSLRSSIDKGLQESDFGIVILSPDFFNKNWTQYELDSLVTLEMAYSRKIIFPVWHNVTINDVIKFSPRLGDKIAALTKNGLDSVLKKILNTLNIKQTGLITYYNFNEDNSISLNWGAYNSDRKFSNIQLEKNNLKPTWHITSEYGESVGVNLLNLPVCGSVSFEYFIHEMNKEHLNIMFYLIPIKREEKLVEIGFDLPVDRKNPHSFYRLRFRPKMVDNQWIKETINFDYRDVEGLDYVIFAPRINEGAPFPAKGKISIRDVIVNEKQNVGQ